MLVIITEHKPIDRGNWRRTWSWKITSKCMLFALRNLLVCKIYIKKRSIPWSPCTREISDFSVQKRIKVIWRTFVPAILSQNDSRQTWHFFFLQRRVCADLYQMLQYRYSSIQWYLVLFDYMEELSWQQDIESVWKWGWLAMPRVVFVEKTFSTRENIRKTLSTLASIL